MLIVGDFRYIDEGNANVVVAYTGNDEIYRNRVLRIPKKNVDVKLIYYNYIRIYNEILPDYRMSIDLVDINPVFLIELSKKIANERNRMQEFDENVSQGLLMENLIAVDGVCDVLALEIKPKWGFVPDRYSSCRFCVHEELKRRASNIPIGKYCPLDLYSRNFNRISKSIRNLQETPKNNFKIFYKQKKIDGANINILEHDLNDIISTILFKSPILEQIKDAQQLKHDLVEELYENREKKDCTLDAETQERIENFMTSVCLKDLSIIISIYLTNNDIKFSPHPTGNEGPNIIQEIELQGGVGFLKNIKFRITAVDLDYKSKDKLKNLKELEKLLDSLHSDKCSMSAYCS
ncbi:Inositol-pentakisphosphate 2-kinase [Terramyces sp. JEL0728]|nr:Inositol-pentakisphosphate 2-kinase [Terramyces sp. JEL0728]